MTKVIEDCRIGGSPIEESTRYVLYDQKKNGEWRYARPESILQSGLGNKFIDTMEFLFETYASLVEPMQGLFQKRLPEDKFQIEVEREGRTVKAGSQRIDKRQ